MRCIRTFFFCSLRSPAECRARHQRRRPHFLLAGDGVRRKSWDWRRVVGAWNWRSVSWHASWCDSHVRTSNRRFVIRGSCSVASAQSWSCCSARSWVWFWRFHSPMRKQWFRDTVTQASSAIVWAEPVPSDQRLWWDIILNVGLELFFFLFHLRWLFSLHLVFFKVRVRVDGQEVLKEPLPKLRALWEDTSFQLERLQANEVCVRQEEEGLAKRTQPYFKLTFDPSEMPGISHLSKTN